MENVKKPLKKSILYAVVLFVSSLCLILSANQYVNYKVTLYKSYQDYIRNVLRYVASQTDVDDLAECIRSGEESAKYRELQYLLDQVKNHVDLHFLYILIPVNTEKTDNIINVMAAMSDEERVLEPGEAVALNQPSGDSYPPGTAKKYLDAYESGELSFFEETSEWGADYTGLLPLFDSEGEKVAALCMDVETGKIHEALRRQTFNMAVIILFLGVLFSAAFMIWSDVAIILPIKKLKKAVSAYAAQNHKQEDPTALILFVPPVHTGNEVDALAGAVKKMSEDMRDYLKKISSTKEELARMNIVAHRDGLTHVGNKTSYEQFVKEHNLKMASEMKPFSVLVLDMDNLRMINNQYGHEKGDLYLKKMSSIVCDVYKRSPVFRIGGDEFVIVLEGRDYTNRRALMEKLTGELESARKTGADPWDRISVSVGCSDFVREVDNRFEDVYARAEKLMQEDKEQKKQ